MSQYPYGYDQYYQAVPYPPPPNQYAFPNPSSYPPAPVHGSPQDPSAPAPNYYAMTQGAFEYNRNIQGIPGLGIVGTPATGAPYQPPPAAPRVGWGHPGNMNSPFATSTPGAPAQQQPYDQFSAPAQFNGPADQPYQLPPRQPPPHSTNNPTPSSNNDPHMMSVATQSRDEMEEGELSEGQFEDLYEPKRASPEGKGKAVERSIPDVPDHSQPTSAADTPDGGFYATEEEGSESRTRSRPSAGARFGNRNGHQESGTVRERSGSYSPYLSPREMQGGGVPKEASENGGPQADSRPKTQTAPRVLNGNGHVTVPGLGEHAKSAPHASKTFNGMKADKSLPSQNPTTNGNSQDVPTVGFRSLTEAKKEAQKSILKLWPLGVKYQHYIDEGFDDKVLKRLFGDLHLDMSTGKPIQPDATQTAQQAVASGSRTSAAATATSKSPTTERKSLTQSRSGSKAPEADKMDKSEERKDRIARLLAAKAAKGPAPAPAPAPTPAQALASTSSSATVQATAPAPAPVPVAPQASVNTSPQTSPQTPPQTPAPPPGQAPASTPAPASGLVQALDPVPAQGAVLTNVLTTAKSSATSTPTMTKPKTKEEIERLLRQKMEALQKSREVGTRKADSDKTGSSPVRSGAASTEAMQPTSATARLAQQQPPIVPASGSLSFGSSGIANTSQQQQSNQDLGPIPGLFLSSTPQQPLNARKRPVASDFVDYPSASGPRKRPFGQGRQDSSLVIDVSDASDDEEMDIDMELDSPTETPSSMQLFNAQGRKGPSLAEFPPLRDMPRRQVSSPAPSARVPPGGSMTAKEKELLAKEKAIQEMRRKIAEAEAKAKLKAKIGSQTPNQVPTTPSESHDSVSSVNNGPRASSVSGVEKIDGPSAQLIAEAVSAELPKPPEFQQKDNMRSERRSRIVSLDADSALEEKKKRLAALREREARIREEQERIREEEAKLEAEFEEEMEMRKRLDDEASQREHMSVDEPSPEASPKDDEAQQHGLTQAALSPEESLLETHEKPLNPAATATSEERQTDENGRKAGEVTWTCDTHVPDSPHLATEGSGSQENDIQMDDAHGREAPVGNQSDGFHAPSATANNNSLPSSTGDVPMAEEVPVTEQASKSFAVDNTTKESAATEAIQPQEHMIQDPSDHAPIPVSPPFSPAPAANPAANGGEDSDGHAAPESSLMPATISDVPQARDEQNDIEQLYAQYGDKAAGAGEPQQDAASKPSTGFVPYESPLRYFRAFKFHPEFNKVVPGGVKSLTYSNKIDPRKELCPSELQGGACPRGDACEYQHLSAIALSDEQLLVELGNSDDYKGEQKGRFIQGLKELLQDFRANKVRDFDTIAHGIIEFRSRFLGDSFKILPLEGVKL